MSEQRQWGGRGKQASLCAWPGLGFEWAVSGVMLVGGLEQYRLQYL